MDKDKKNDYGKFAGLIGIILLFASLILFGITTKSSIPYIILGLGAIAIIINFVFRIDSYKEMFKTKGFKKGFSSIIAIILVTGILVTLYILSKHIAYKKDFTEEKLYTLSEQTKTVVKDINFPVRFLVLSEESEFKNNDSYNLVELYRDLSDKIEISYIPPLANPKIFNKYKIPTTGEGIGAIVVEKLDEAKKTLKHITILPRDMYDQSMNPQTRQPVVKFLGESKLTSALANLQGISELIIYATEGHGEKSFEDTSGAGFSNFKKSLVLENYQVKTINLLTSKEIPKDCALLFIAGPTNPFTTKEVDKIKEYLKNGGRLLIMLDPQIQYINPESKEKPTESELNLGLAPLFEEWNIQLDSSFVMEHPDNMVIDALTGRIFHVGQYGFHQIVDPLNNKKLPILFFFSRAFDVSSSKPSDQYQIQPLLQFGWGEKEGFSPDLQKNIFNPNIDLKAPATFGMAITGKTKNKEDKNQSRIVVLGDSDFIADGFPKDTYNNGRDLVLNSVNWLTQQEKKITIRPKERKDRKMILTNSKMAIIFYSTVFIIPFSIILIGGLVHYSRRNQKK